MRRLLARLGFVAVPARSAAPQSGRCVRLAEIETMQMYAAALVVLATVAVARPAALAEGGDD